MKAPQFFVVLILFLTAQLSFSEPVMDVSYGIALHELDLDDGQSIRAAGQYINLSFGQRFKHSLSGSVALRGWWEKDSDDETDQDESHVYGLSLGVEGQMFLPMMDHGPYAKLGRHCWGISLIDTLNVWSGSGCSNIVGAGILLKPESGENEGSGIFYEVVLTRFKQMNSWMFVVGKRI